MCSISILFNLSTIVSSCIFIPFYLDSILTDMSTSYYFARDLSADELSKKQQGSGCLAYDPLVDPTYGYVPNRAVGIIFAVIFGVIMVLHIGQASIKKKWWYYTFAIAALGKLN